MTTFSTILDNVYVLTKRPDLIAETKSAVKKATLKLHNKDLWEKDLKEVIVTLTPSTLFRYSLDLTDAGTYPRIKKIKSIREYNAIPTGRELKLEKHDSDDIFDDYQIERVNYFYLAGLAANLVVVSALTQIKVGYYQYPDITELTYSSWIANELPDYIAEEAARSLFKLIGKDEEFQKFEAICKENETALTMTQI